MITEAERSSIIEVILYRLDHLEASFEELKKQQGRIVLLLFGNLVGIIVLLATRISSIMAAR